MGFFSGVTHSIQKAGKQASQNITNAGVAPFQIVARQVGGVIKAGAPVIGQATQVLKQNPQFASLAGNALGLPGIGSAFGGTDIPSGPGQPLYQAAQSQTMTYVLIGVAAVVLIFVLKR